MQLNPDFAAQLQGAHGSQAKFAVLSPFNDERRPVLPALEELQTTVVDAERIQNGRF